MRVSSFSRPVRLFVAFGPLACSVLLPLAARAQNAAPAAPVTAIDAVANTNSWTTFKGDPQRTGASSAQVTLPLSLQWRYSSDGPTRSFLSSPLVLGTPGKQRLYFVIGNQLLCLDGQSGSPAPEWKAPQLSGTVSAPLTLLSTDDGDFILTATQGGQVSAYNAADGRQAWQLDLQNGIGDAGPLVVTTSAGTRIIVAMGDGNLIALTPGGQRDSKWRVALGAYGNPPTSAMSLSPNGSILYVTATDAKLYGVDTRIGRVAWSIPLPNQTNVVPVVAGRVVVTAGLDRIAAFDAAGGAPKWSVPSRGSVSASPAFRVVNDVPSLFYGNAEGDFYSLDARDGKQNWKTSLGVPLSGAPVALNDMVLVGTSTGLLVALNPRTGIVLWQYRLKTERLLNNRGGGAGRGGRGRGNAQPASDQNEAGSSLWRGGFQTVQDGGDVPGGGFPGGGFPGGDAPGGGFPGGDSTDGGGFPGGRFPGGGFPGGGFPGGGFPGGGFPGGGFPGGGFPGGGFPGGGGNFPGGNAAPATQQFSKPYGISAAPSVVNGRVFVQGDDATVYAFTSQAIDADAPRVVEPAIALNDRTDKLTTLLVGGQTAPSVPGRGPFYFAAGIDDVGSGVDPQSVRVSLDGTPVDPKKVDFDAGSGTLTVTLLDGTTGGANFPDGQKTLTVSGRDYAGNALEASFNFFIDNTAPAPAPKSQGRRASRFPGDNGPDNNTDTTGDDPNTR